MSFAVHPEQEDFRNEFAHTYCARERSKFWGTPCQKQAAQEMVAVAQRSNKQQTNNAIKQTTLR
jgi:hypothetical protein